MLLELSGQHGTLIQSVVHMYSFFFGRIGSVGLQKVDMPTKHNYKKLMYPFDAVFRSECDKMLFNHQLQYINHTNTHGHICQNVFESLACCREIQPNFTLR